MEVGYMDDGEFKKQQIHTISLKKMLIEEPRRDVNSTKAL